MAFSENAKIILKHLQENNGKYETALMIAEKTGLAPKTVNGVVTSALQRQGLAQRLACDGFDKKVIRLTKAGMEANPDEE